MNDFEKIMLLYEDITLNKFGKKDILLPTNNKKGVKKEDLSNFIFANTNGGTENFTVWTIRENNSKNDPNKKAGDVMVINGKLKIPENIIKGVGSTQGTALERYKKYNTITIYVSSLDGINYIKKYNKQKDRIRNLKVDKIFKLRIGGETYNIV